MEKRDNHETQAETVDSTTDVMSIGQLAKSANVSNRTVRYYEELGLIVPLSRGSNRYRYYDETHVDRLKLIKMLQESGFALKEIVGALNPILDPQGNITYSGLEMAQQISSSLHQHRKRLMEKQLELQQAVRTIDSTLKELGHCFNCENADDISNCANCPNGPSDVVNLGRRIAEIRKGQENNSETEKARI